MNSIRMRHNRWVTIFYVSSLLFVDIVELMHSHNEKKIKRKEMEHLLYGRGTYSHIHTHTRWNAVVGAAIQFKRLFIEVCHSVLCSMKMISGKRSVWENRKRMSSIFHSFDKMWHIIHHKMMMMMRLKFPFKVKECGG